MNEIKWKAASEKGTGHRRNQDAWFCDVLKNHRDRGIFAIADGVGSLDAPATASRLVISGIRDWWKKTDSGGLGALKVHLEIIDQAIRDYGTRRGLCMATTLSVLLIDGAQGGILQIGDSKILRLRRRGAELLTIDHLLSREGLLISCLGNARAHFDVMERYIPISAGECFLLGSDAVFKRKPALRPYVFGREKELLTTVRDLGETDDLTAVGVEVGGNVR